MKSVVEIIGEIVGNCEEGLSISVTDGSGALIPLTSPHITYIFGNAQYVKEQLDDYSRANYAEGADKFPLIVLFTPVTESRVGSTISECSVSMLIACSSHKEWTNEVRYETSFKNILYPIYERLLLELTRSGLVEVGYKGVQHTYSENYSYGRFGAYTDNNEKLSEPIDAIDISDLKIKVKFNNCLR